MLILVTTTRTIKTLHSRKLASEVHSSEKKIQALNISARMSNSICLTPVCSLKPTNNPGLFGGNSVPGKVLRVNEVFQNSKVSKFQSLQVKADSNPGSKPNSILCANCDGNGAVACSQCKGHGVNSVDHFNGQFKAGGLCWLCRGKREMLCGDCNGAGFMGGFMSTFDS